MDGLHIGASGEYDNSFIFLLDALFKWGQIW